MRLAGLASTDGDSTIIIIKARPSTVVAWQREIHIEKAIRDVTFGLKGVRAPKQFTRVIGYGSLMNTPWMELTLLGVG